jgi:hypothetical protein
MKVKGIFHEVYIFLTCECLSSVMLCHTVYQTTWCNIPEKSQLHTCHSKNIISLDFLNMILKKLHHTQ